VYLIDPGRDSSAVGLAPSDDIEFTGTENIHHCGYTTSEAVPRECSESLETLRVLYAYYIADKNHCVHITKHKTIVYTLYKHVSCRRRQKYKTFNLKP